MTELKKENKDEIEIKIELKRKHKLNYALGSHIYANYVKHFVENKAEGQIIKLVFYCEGESKIPLGFVSGIIDGFGGDSILLEDMQFKVHSIDILARDGRVRNVMEES